MASTQDFRNGLVLNWKDDLWQIVEFMHVKPGKGGAFVRGKLKNVRNGKIVDTTFRAGEKVETVRVERRQMQFLYEDDLGLHVMNTETYEQRTLRPDMIEGRDLVKEGATVDVLVDASTEEPLSVELPRQVELAVVQTDPRPQGRHRDGRHQAGRARVRRDGLRAAVHQRGRRDPRRHRDGELPDARDGRLAPPAPAASGGAGRRPLPCVRRSPSGGAGRSFGLPSACAHGHGPGQDPTLARNRRRQRHGRSQGRGRRLQADRPLDGPRRGGPGRPVGRDGRARAAPLAPPASAPTAAPAPAAPAEAPAAAKEPGSGANESLVLAPIVGTYYEAPSPDSDPFIKAGDRVEVGQTLCIIEAMKLMNEIQAEEAGTVTQLLVGNGEPVEFDQPLFVIEK